jgi:transcriptional regulator with XRE-family HTH domain
MQDTGRRLRRVRETRGLSQRALARAAGVSNATISLIENGRTDPSLGMLKRILDALDTSVADFFALDLPNAEQVFFRAGELSEISRGAISYRQLGGDLSRHRLQILYESYRPGADTGTSPLAHDAEEGGVVISGRLEVTVDGRTEILEPGDAYLFDSRLPHRFRNPGPDDCLVVSACTPPSF